MKIKNLIAVAALLMGSTNAFAYDLPATFNNGGLQYEATITDAAARTANVTLKGVADNEKGKALIAAKAIETVSNFTVDLDGDVWTCKVVGIDKLWETAVADASTVESVSFNCTNFPYDNDWIDGFATLKGLTIIDKEETPGMNDAYFASITFPATLETVDVSKMYGVKNIAANAFKDKTALVSIALPAGLVTIGDGAFWGCTSLECDYEVPATMTSIGARAFQETGVKADFSKAEALATLGIAAFLGDTKIETADLSKTALTTIQASTFEKCSALTTVDLTGLSLTSIDTEAFKATAIASITIPATVTTIGNMAFYGTAITAIDVPEAVTTIGTGVFAKCEQLATVTGLAGITTIPDETFNGCTALATVPDLTKITTIGVNAFNGTALTTITLGDVSVAEYAFANCAALTEATINSGKVWAYAFQSCTSLKTVNFVAPAVDSDIYPNAFIGCIYPVKIKTLVEFFTHDPAAALQYPRDTNADPATIEFWAPTNCEFEAVAPEAAKITTKNGFAKWYSTTESIAINPADAKVFSVYADNAGDGTIYFQSLKLDGGKYIVNAGDHVVIQSSAEEVEYELGVVGFSVLIDEFITFDGATTLAAFQSGTPSVEGQGFWDLTKLYRLTNKNGIGFSVFTGTKMGEGQFFIQSKYTPDAEGRAKIVWLDEDGNVIDGAATAIKGVKAAAEAGAIYNLSGQKVNASYKGVVIKDGKKYIQK